jgi:hypothetical protein
VVKFSHAIAMTISRSAIPAEKTGLMAGLAMLVVIEF